MEKGKQVVLDLNSDIADDILHDYENDEYLDFHQKSKDELASNEVIANKDELTSIEDVAILNTSMSSPSSPIKLFEFGAAAVGVKEVLPTGEGTLPCSDCSKLCTFDSPDIGLTLITKFLSGLFFLDDILSDHA
ncbi:unnamed protein product [Ilex paraguariensis]|uniref:Uncharacterized protein n=1 Tax=Ilex paraguariensis TaxID=185542 RepID=A0ABC8RR15_9AQUA